MRNNFFATNVFFEKKASFFYLVIAIFCFIIYANTIPNDYGLDDHLVSNHNPVIEKGIGGLYEIFTTNYISDNGIYLDYRPLVKASYAIEYSLFGWNPHISHLINILLYALGCCLLLGLLLKFFGNQYFSTLFIGILIYAAHPMHAEVVASLKNRDEIFVLIFVTLSSLCFLRYAETNNLKFFGTGFLFFFTSLLSKITSIPFIAIIPLMVYLKNRDGKKATIIFLSLAIFTGVYYLFLIKALPGFARPYEYVETPLPFINDYSIKLGTALYALLVYFKLLIVPVQFSFYYGINFIELKPVFNILPLVSFVVYLSLLVMAFYFFSRNKFLSFFLFFYLLQISLASNIIQPLPGVVGERVLFLASLSFCMAISFLINHFFKQNTRELDEKKGRKSEITYLSFRTNYLHVSIILFVLLFYSYNTIARNADWKDTMTLFEADMPHLENSAKANYMMAKEIRRLYRTDRDLTQNKLQEESSKAVYYYNQAIRAYPKYALAMEELGMLYAIELKNNSMAIPLFEKAFALDSTLWRSANNLGMAFQMSKDTSEAIVWYENSLKAKADNKKALVELAKLYYLNGRKQMALTCNEKLLQLAPDSYLPYYNYGVYYMLERDTINAVKYFEQDVSHGEIERFPYLFLIKYYLEQHDTTSAIRIRNFAPRHSR